MNEEFFNGGVSASKLKTDVFERYALLIQRDHLIDISAGVNTSFSHNPVLARWRVYASKLPSLDFCHGKKENSPGAAAGSAAWDRRARDPRAHVDPADDVGCAVWR